MGRRFTTVARDDGVPVTQQLVLGPGFTIEAGSSTPAGGNGTFPQFIRLAQRVSGEQLDDLFRVWLFTGAKPVLEGATAAATARATATSPSAAATLERARGGQRLRH
jgi:hypothetical protein